MIKTLKDLLFLCFCLIITDVHSLNYGYSVSRFGSYPSYLSSAPSSPFLTSPSNLEPNITAKSEHVQKLYKPASPYAIYYPPSFPQRRGGKNLNLTVVTESSLGEKVQPRILNKATWYPNSSLSGQSFKKVPSISPNPAVLQERGFKESPPIGKNAYIISGNRPFVYASNDDDKDMGSIYSSERVRKIDFPKPNFGQSFVYPSPHQHRPQTDVPLSFLLQKIYKNQKLRYNVPHQLYQATNIGYTLPPPRTETHQNWPCFCVPYYLCKNGVINSGGRSVAAIRRKARSFKYISGNTTQFPPFYPSKIINSYEDERGSDTNQCEERKVCCRLSFADDVPYSKDDRYYPVATPRPEPYYPSPPIFANREREMEICGVRRAYGLHARLRHLQYPSDVSEFGEYPWQVAILRKIEGQRSLYICGGTLINYQWVATAAHCVKNDQFSPLLIRLGEWDVNRRDELYPFIEKDVDTIILHPEFNPDTLYNDLALVRMKTPVDARIPHITPACLPNRETLYDDQRCWVSGWGKNFFGPQGEYQSVLKEVDVPVIMREICSSELKNTNLGSDFNLHPGFLCAGGEAGKDACTGDGGSPLVCKSGRLWYVVGIVSWGVGCGQPGVPGVYVNMLYYSEWINSIIVR